MQEEPVSINIVTPLHLRLFILFVLFVVVVFVVRSFQLAWNLWLSRHRSRAVSKDSAHLNADSIARAALVGRSLESALPLDPNNDDSMRRGPALLSLLAESEIRFAYLVATCSAEVRSLRKLAVLTLIISLLETTWGLVNDLAYIAEYNSTVWSGIRALSENLTPLAVGLFLCAVLYAAYAFYEGVLQRRKAKWQYHCSTFRSRVSEPVAAAIPN